MSKPIKLEIVTPERVVFSEEVTSIILPGVDGYFGVLANHAPLVAALRIGPVVYRQNGEKHRVAIHGGFFEIAENHAVILADAAELSGEIDVERARAALERARKRIRDRQADLDLVRAQAAIERALTRLRVAGAA